MQSCHVVIIITLSLACAVRATMGGKVDSKAMREREKERERKRVDKHVDIQLGQTLY